MTLASKQFERLCLLATLLEGDACEVHHPVQVTHVVANEVLQSFPAGDLMPRAAKHIFQLNSLNSLLYYHYMFYSYCEIAFILLNRVIYIRAK